MYRQYAIFRFSALTLLQESVLICVNPCLFSSILVENPLQIYPFLCKTNPISAKVRMSIRTVMTSTYLGQQRTMNNEQCFKTNPIKPNQTQFQNRQNERNLICHKGLCKSTTNYELRTIPKTNPIKPNQTQFQRSPLDRLFCSSHPNTSPPELYGWGARAKDGIGG